MAYSRPPVQAGRGLTRSPANPGQTQTGVFDYSLESDIATTTSLGIVQIGSGLAITPLGVLSATNTGNGIYSVKLTKVNYTAIASDYYIGAIDSGITITLPKGVLGKIYVVKNQDNAIITVKSTTPEKINGASSQILSTNQAITVIFTGTQWEII
jgi:hypothetical protein